MMAANWPTAGAIEARIQLSNRVNQRPVGPLTGMGPRIVGWGRRYGINPAVVTAIMQRESQLGADGSTLPETCCNYGGITDARGVRSTTTPVFYGDRTWACFRTPAEGVEAVFRVLDESGYRATDGTLGAVMARYSPAYENDQEQVWFILRRVGQQLGVRLEPETAVYARTVRDRVRSIFGR